MKKAVIHFVQHSCGPQECDCSPRCHAREGDEIVTSSSVAAVTCKNCLRGLKKDLHPDLPKSKTVAEERDQLKAEVETLRESNDKLTRRNEMLEQNVKVMTETHVLYTWLRKKVDQPSNDFVAVHMNIGHDWTPVHDLDRDLRGMIEREEP